MPNADGIHERMLVEANLRIEPGAFLYVRSIWIKKSGEEVPRTYRFRMSVEQTIELMEDMIEVTDRYNLQA